ncbi:contactin [Anopheles ziemanni]|uniref:contactin n=1 Tax=Anopheles ziemanni TaxID=345580 RepID=UPI0026589712|nr:contactin isoform X1 [Anopheles coustani]XP_058175706.1 contactin [Anopheles ziemanni]
MALYLSRLILFCVTLPILYSYGQQSNNVLRGNSPFYEEADDYLKQQRSSSGIDDIFLRTGGDRKNIDDYFCPEYWTAFRSTCLRVHKSPRKSWFNAQKICQAYQGDLVSVDTIEKHSFVVKLLDQDVSKQNRYYISARQVSPGNWVNADKSQLIAIEDAINYEESIEASDEFQSYFEGSKNVIEKDDQDDPRRFYQSDRYRNRNYLLLGFNGHKEKWQFHPVSGEDQFLFICESRNLYSADNMKTLLEDQRQYDYGLEQTDLEKIPRGPYFIRQPVDTTYDTGKFKITKDVTMSCLAGGYPTPKYTWYKEEYVKDNLTVIPIDPLKNARHTVSGGNLIIHNPSQNLDQGTYHCTAQNIYGKIISESVQLNFGYILEFNLQRASEKGEENWGKALVCEEPQHYPDVKYYWSRNYFPNFVYEDQRVFVSHDGSLYFSSLEVMDRANYSCTVMSTVSDTGRNGPFFELWVSPSPHYQDLIFANSFPKAFPKVPLAGKDVRLECMTYGYPVASYNWTRRNGQLPRLAKLENYNRVLLIQNATVNDNGEYLCTAKNGKKSIMQSIFLNVQMEPNFTIPLRDRTKDFQSTVSFLCEAFAMPDVNYTWYKNGELMAEDGQDARFNKDKYTIQDNLLKINYLEPEEDNGMYQCKATNQLKGVYSAAQLRVLSMKPSFKKRPLESEIYSIANGNTTIHCEPEAAPTPKIVWKKDGNVIGAGGHRKIHPGTGTLFISPTSRDDEGTYTCVATNTQGMAESKARLIVLQELRFTEQLPSKLIKQIGELLFLRCEVTYDQLLDVAFIWTHNGQLLNDYGHEFEQVASGSVEGNRIRIHYNTLEVHNITLVDGGEYECIAKSSVNRIVSRSTVLIQGPPGAPGAVKVLDIKRTEALLEWTNGNDNGRPILFYNILGRTTWNRTWVNVTTNVVAQEADRYNGRRQATVTNLTPWCSYEFAVVAVNDLGIGTPSLPSPVYSTQKDRPYLAPRNVGGGGGKIGDLTITWDPLRPDEQNSIDVHYKVFYRLYGQREWASEELKRQGNSGKAVIHVSVDKYYTRYEVKVQAINDLGEGPISDPVEIYSAEDMPQVAPQQTIARSYNSTALNVTWQAVSQNRETIRGKLIGHRLKYWKKEHNEEDSVYYLSRTTRPWALIVGLEPDTYYYVKVMAYNAAGEGPESERYLERTYRKAPQKPPSSVDIFGINPSTIRVTWRYIAPSQDEEPVQGYKIRIWEKDQDMSSANDTVVPIGKKLEKYIDNLTPGKSYNLRVLAFSNGGDGRMSSPPIQFQMGITQSPLNNSNKMSIPIVLLVVLSVLCYVSTSQTYTL